jgi:hypothetical protein
MIRWIMAAVLASALLFGGVATAAAAGDVAGQGKAGIAGKKGGKHKGKHKGKKGRPNQSS